MERYPDFKNYKDRNISNDINQTLIDLRTITGNTMDLNIMEIKICGVKCAVVTIEGMVSTSSMAELVFHPLMNFKSKTYDVKNIPKEIFKFITEESLLSSERKIIINYGDVLTLLFSGFAVIFVDSIERCTALGIQGYVKKAVTEPTSEHNIMGSHDGFAEVIRTNISLIRRRMKTPSLRFEMMQIGEKSNTDVCMVYIADRASEELVNRIRCKLKKIKLDTILASGYIKPFLEEKLSIGFFSEVSATERPDIVCGKINEGRVAVLIDGTPFALVCPSLFIENFRTMDDFCSKPYYVTFLRIIRYTAFFFATAFPGFYIAITNFHPEMLTLKLLLNLTASEQPTPYPLYVEMLIIMALLELMREAAIRLPNAVGSAISIVGGLIIGDAAVKSGIISSPLLIIVGLTATASFAVPGLNQQASVLRFMYIIAGGAAGFAGLAVCSAMIMTNIAATDAFHIPYTAPVTPFYKKSISSILSRNSFKKMQEEKSNVNEYRTD